MSDKVPESRVRTLINGALLPQFTGQVVTIFGTVIDIDKSGTSFDLKTTDKHIVTVAMRKPLTEQIAGLVEVHGIVKGKNSVVCDYYIVFPEELAKTYDNEMTNTVTQILHSITNPWRDAEVA